MEEGKKNSSSNGGDSGGGKKMKTVPVATTVTVDLKDLDCTLCLKPLRPPVLQCTAGHVVCSTCYEKLPDKEKWQLCSVTTYNRCYAIERILQSVQVPCSNTRFGCTAKMAYNKKEEHESKCIYAPLFPGSNGGLIVRMGLIGGHNGCARDMDVLGVNRIVKVVIFHSSTVNAMSVFYERDNGEEKTNVWGGVDGKSSEICLQPDEYLSDVKGYFGHHDTLFIIRSLTFVSNQRSFGPYGKEAGESFGLPAAAGGKIIGFHARSGRYLKSKYNKAT